ncbi:MAG: HAD family hydrolase [Mycoplasmoidaceae bacterium]
MQYKWASIDLDHTLLEKSGTISHSSYEAIKEYQNLGGRIFICTGRWLISAIAFNRKIENYTRQANDFLICLNGALIFDLLENKTIYSNCISDEDLKRLLTIREETNIALWLYSIRGINERKIFTIKLPLKKIVEKFNYGKIVSFKEDQYEFKNDSLKILFLSFSVKKVNETFKRLEEEFTGELAFCRTSKRSIEVTNKNCNKGEAIKFVTKKYNINKNSIVAFGDSNNDVSMFKEVGYKIAINPSSKELIELADHISKDKDAFSYAMRNFVINQK